MVVGLDSIVVGRPSSQEEWFGFQVCPAVTCPRMKKKGKKGNEASIHAGPAGIEDRGARHEDGAVEAPGSGAGALGQPCVPRMSLHVAPPPSTSDPARKGLRGGMGKRRNCECGRRAMLAGWRRGQRSGIEPHALCGEFRWRRGRAARFEGREVARQRRREDWAGG